MRIFINRLPTNDDDALIRTLEACNQTKRRCFSTAARSQKRENFAFRDTEIKT